MKRLLTIVAGLVTGACSGYPYAVDRACSESASCGDGERCGGGTCEAVGPGSACVESPDCGNGQRCGSSGCAPVPIGSGCEEDTDCGNLQRCGDQVCVFEPPPGGCVADAGCGEAERCVEAACVPIVGDPDTCPAPALFEQLVCTDWERDECPCYAGPVSFHEKDEGGRLSCAGVVGIFSPIVYLKQSGCRIEALDDQLTGYAVGFGELKLRIANLPNDTSCSAQRDVWTGAGGAERPAIRITCSATCRLWMEQLPAPAEERVVPGGSFVMGTPPGQVPIDRPGEGPAHEVAVTCFSMDRFEVSRDQYRECLEVGTCTAPDYLLAGEEPATFFSVAERSLPMTFVSHAQADVYCRFNEKSLPTEAEWERAARSDPGRYEPWPWGATPPFTSGGRPDCALAMFAGCGDAPRPVGDGGADRERGPSFFRVADLGGNVREWTRDFYVDDAYERLAGGGARNPEVLAPGPLGNARVVRGGSFLSALDRDALPPSDALRVSARDHAPETDTFTDVGFRCVRYKPGVAR